MVLSGSCWRIFRLTCLRLWPSSPLYPRTKYSEDNPEVGAVFVYEAIMEGKSLGAQDHFFQVALPVVQTRYILTLPTVPETNKTRNTLRTIFLHIQTGRT
jgi:hypothetical protein